MVENTGNPNEANMTVTLMNNGNEVIERYNNVRKVGKSEGELFVHTDKGTIKLQEKDYVQFTVC